VVAVLALAGCSATSSPVPAPSSARPDTTTSSAIASPSQGGLSGPSVSSSGGTPGVTPGVALRCASALSPGLASIELGGPTPTDRLAAGEVGSGSVAVVLLHQTGRAAMCGWAPYAGWLATQGVRVLALDFCGYGQSTCQSASFAADPVAQVKVAVEKLRASGATRITVVGASMGGTIAVAAAAPVGADAVVDLSGPVRWPPYDTNAVLPTLTMPTLLAVNESDDAQAHAVMQAGTTQVPATHKLFVSAPAGHGWDLVMSRTDPSAPPTALGRLVADWIAGRYPAG